MKRDPYQIVKHRHVTEKSQMLEGLKDAKSNICLKRCTTPKYVFVVDPLANKQEIAWAVEEIYSERKIKVVGVNTVSIKGKERRVRGRSGMTKSLKKAIVSLRDTDSLETV